MRRETKEEHGRPMKTMGKKSDHNQATTCGPRRPHTGKPRRGTGDPGKPPEATKDLKTEVQMVDRADLPLRLKNDIYRTLRSA